MPKEISEAAGLALLLVWYGHMSEVRLRINAANCWVWPPQ